MILKVLDPLLHRTIVWIRWCDKPLKRQLFLSCRTSASVSRCSIFYRDDASDYYAFRRRLNYSYIFGVGSQEASQNYLCLPSVSYSTERNENTPGKDLNINKKSDRKDLSNQGSVPNIDSESGQDGKNTKVSIFKRFKEMYRDYWYVLVPVHVITSLGWFGGFYYLAQSGVDIVAILDSLGVSEKILNSLRDSKAGYLAVAYALYKIATPLRYMVTIGGTTVSIKYLKEYGYIKPMPSKEKLKEIYNEKKENLIEKRQHFADGIKQKKEKWKESRDKLMRDRRE